jgi:hypothetical protein
VLSPNTVQHLCDAYGDRVATVLSLAADRDLWMPLVEGHPYIEAEVVHAVQVSLWLHVYAACVLAS